MRRLPRPKRTGDALGSLGARGPGLCLRVAPRLYGRAGNVERLAISKRHVYSLLETGQIPGGMSLGRTGLVRRAPFEAWLGLSLPAEQFGAQTQRSGVTGGE